MIHLVLMSHRGLNGTRQGLDAYHNTRHLSRDANGDMTASTDDSVETVRTNLPSRLEDSTEHDEAATYRGKYE